MEVDNMTIITILYIPEGIVLGSDTQMTIHAKGKPVNSFKNSQKFFNISIENGKYNYALSQAGKAMPGRKPLSTHIYTIRELLSLNGYSDEDFKSMSKVTDIIIEYFKGFEKDNLIGSFFYFSGFDQEDNKVIPCIYSIQFIKTKDGKLEVKKKLVAKPEKREKYGLAYAGKGQWIISKLLKLSDPSQGIPKRSIPYHLLSLKDGVEFTDYLIRSVIGLEKFTSTFPSCGGKVRVAILTPKEFRFIKDLEEDLLI